MEGMFMDRRIPQLDGIRAIAILSVILTHTWTAPFLNGLAQQAQAGVDLFFVLSGFLITGVLLAGRDAKGYYTNFYGRRALRIFPLFFLVLTIIFVVWPTSPYLAQPRDHWRWYFLFASNILLAFTGPQLKTTDITWSLAVEEQFYFVWPSVVRHVSGKTLARVCIGIIVTVPLLRLVAHDRFAPFAIHVLTPFRIDEFAMGALICVVARERIVSEAVLRRVGIWLFTVAGGLFITLCASGALPNFPWYSDVLHYSLTGAAASGLLLLALYSRRTAKALQRPWLLHIGAVSYGMYLYHEIVLVFFSKTAEKAYPHGLSPVIYSAVSFTGVTMVTILVATASFRYFESPLLRLKSRFVSTGTIGCRPPLPLKSAPTNIAQGPSWRRIWAK